MRKMVKLRKLTIILPSEASMDMNEKNGLIVRWRRLFEEYKKYFEKVEVYTCDREDYSSKLNIKHIPCEILINKKYLKAYTYNVWLKKRMKLIDSDVIRFFGSEYPMMPSFVKTNHVPKITSYQYDLYMKSKLDFGRVRGLIAYIAEKYTIKYVGNVITTTYELRQILLDRYGVNSVINPNFVDLEIFKPSSDEKDYLFYAGRVFYTKGIDNMIGMMNKFQSEGLNIKLYLAGNGDTEHYKKLVDEKGLSENIVFLGSLPPKEVAKYMSQCKVFLLPTTTQEGHPKSLIEALAAGAPCVATKVLGNTDVITNEQENGVLVEPNNTEALYKAVKMLLSDEKARRKMKDAAVISAKKYDIKTVVANEIEIFKSIIKG